MTCSGSRFATGALLLTSVGLLACPAELSGPPPALAPSTSPAGATSRSVAAAPPLAMAPIEAGFTPCCGSERYRIEIECGEMLKRCYENRGGSWRQTFGRHCKEQLGEACYLERCDSKCR